MGATESPIQDPSELFRVAENAIAFFSGVEPQEKWWYIVFLQITPMGSTIANITIKGTHPLIWAAKNSPKPSRVVASAQEAASGGIQVLNFVEIPKAVAEELLHEKANPK